DFWGGADLWVGGDPANPYIAWRNNPDPVVQVVVYEIGNPVPIFGVRGKNLNVSGLERRSIRPDH
ncbi:MAG: hypothetical protein JRJ59_13335, partial [Deltaproteobacteria bacterium]|nr:hypothetical protein [Deltaproteobacteria bacterium]